MQTSYDAAPALPRAPTVIRSSYGGSPASSSAPPPSPPPAPDMGARSDAVDTDAAGLAPPPPPRFPSLTDVGLGPRAQQQQGQMDLLEQRNSQHGMQLASSSSLSEEGTGLRLHPAAAGSGGSDFQQRHAEHVSFASSTSVVASSSYKQADAPAIPVPGLPRTEVIRNASATARAARSRTSSAKRKKDEHSESYLKKVLTLLKPKPKTADELEAEARARAEAKPALVKAQEAICKLPDPTLLFMLLIALILLVFKFRPELLKTWTARIIVPLSLVNTVAATTLWRRTRVISLKPDDRVLSVAAPFPDAGLLVMKGEKIRQREAALSKAEEDLRAGRMKLEVMRKKIESRLPPDVTVHLDHKTGSVRRQGSYHSASLPPSPTK